MNLYKISDKLVFKTLKDIKFGYRKASLPDNLIFLSASFKGIKSKPNEIKKEIL